MIHYTPDQFSTWNTLDSHLKNPTNFPTGKTTNFFVIFSPTHGDPRDYPWELGESLLFLGEIPGMDGHGIFAGDDGLVRFAYHTHDFRVIPQEEL